MSSEHEEPELIEDVAAEAPPPPTQDSSVSERRRFAASPPLVVAPTPSHPQRCRAGRDVPYAELSFPAEDSFRQADRRGTGQDASTDDQARRMHARAARRLHPSVVRRTHSAQRKEAVALRVQTGQAVRLTSHRPPPLYRLTACGRHAESPAQPGTTKTCDLHRAESALN